jgi:hypothetical protein
LLGDREDLSATYRRADGTPIVTKVRAVTYADLREIARQHPTPKLKTDFATREAKLLVDGFAYFRPGPFMNIDQSQSSSAPSYNDSDYRKFLDDAFRRFIAARTTDLIIDLRNNPGGDNSFSDSMVAWFADRPFRFASRFMLKASGPTKAWYEQHRARGQPVDKILARLMQAESRHSNGVRYPFEIETVAPRANGRFNGRVWVLVNRHSYSNSASVAALIQDYRFGTVLGEETADLPTNYASIVQFGLPNSGYTVDYPKSYFVRPNGDETLRGVIPDIRLSREPIGVEEDVILNASLSRIRSQH